MWLPRPFSFGHAPRPPWPMRYPALPLVQQQLIDLIINSNPNSSWICLYCLYISHQSFFMLITWVCLQKNKNPSFFFLRNWKSASSEFVRINTIHFEVMTLENIPSLPEAFFDQNSLLTKGTLGIFWFFLSNNEKSLPFFQSQVFVVAFLQLDLPIP